MRFSQRDSGGLEVKLIDNFTELLHNDELPRNFNKWIVIEEGDSKYCKIQPFYDYGGWVLLYRKLVKIFNKDRKNSTKFKTKFLQQFKIFPYMTRLLRLYNHLENYDDARKDIDYWKRNFSRSKNAVDINKHFFRVEEYFND